MSENIDFQISAMCHHVEVLSGVFGVVSSVTTLALLNFFPEKFRAASDGLTYKEED